MLLNRSPTPHEYQRKPKHGKIDNHYEQSLTAVVLDFIKTSNMKIGIISPDGDFVRELFPGF